MSDYAQEMSGVRNIRAFTNTLFVITGTLCPESAEEAKTLIPSLQNKISDEDLDQLLKEINDLRNFVE